MSVFAFEPAEHRRHYEQHGWVHIKKGITPEFHAYLREYVQRQASQNLEDRFRIAGKQSQAVVELPTEDHLENVFDVVAELCGLNRATMTLSERHFKVYDSDANPEPPAHKDRFASQISVGISIDIPPESSLVVYPFEHREVNPFTTAAEHRRSLKPEERPENLLRGAREVVLNDEAGDVVMFPGNDIWHYRRNAANASIVYLKVNDFGCDPLGEDPSTADRRASSLAALESDDHEDLQIMPARRLDGVNRQYTRNGWEDVLWAHVFGEDPMPITEQEFSLIRLAESRPAFADAAEGGNGNALRALIERGILDLGPADADEFPVERQAGRSEMVQR